MTQLTHQKLYIPADEGFVVCYDNRFMHTMQLLVNNGHETTSDKYQIYEAPISSYN